MSTDSSRPTPDPDKIDKKVSKKVKEVAEIDLWDLDSDDFESAHPPASTPSNTGDPSVPIDLPTQRKSISSLQTKKPTDWKSKPLVITGKTETQLDSAEISTPLAPETDAFPETLADEPTAATRQWDETQDRKVDPKEVKPLPTIYSFSKIEKIAIAGLLAALAISATLTLIHFSNRLPTRQLVADEIDFPVAGKIIEITAASTYWRDPVTIGENADVVRRGTQIIPVVKLSLSSKSGAIRVFFRNEDGLLIGDGISRAVKGETEVTVAATAGFEDIGMHTAYRTGDGKRWIVQVFEGPDATAPREKFRKVLETEISTLIR